MVCCTRGPATAVRRCHPRVSLSSHHDTPERTRPLIKVRPEQDLKKVRPEQFHITRAFRHALPRRLCATSQGLLRARRSSSRTEGTDTRGISGTRGTFMNSSSTYSSFHRSVLTFEIFLGNEISPPDRCSSKSGSLHAPDRVTQNTGRPSGRSKTRDSRQLVPQPSVD
jgi:hypothetical protein